MSHNDELDGLAAWRIYKASMTQLPSRQLRKRDFLAGYLLGVDTERERTRTVVLPANLSLHETIQRLESDPVLREHLRLSIPETIKKLVALLNPVDKK